MYFYKTLQTLPNFYKSQAPETDLLFIRSYILAISFKQKICGLIFTKISIETQ